MNDLNASSCAPIGIFDSGVGGLTVCRKISKLLPFEKIIYLGDTARVPYGSKAPETVLRYARSCAAVLLKYKIKMLVIACNTATAFALEALQKELDIPVLGVLRPGATAALSRTKNGIIGVIGTRGVINSRSYEKTLKAQRPDIDVYSQACPLFVPFAEEGWVSGDALFHVARHYLEDLKKKKIDTLVLGCTHYPLLKNTIQAVLGEDVMLVDSAEETAKDVVESLDKNFLFNKEKEVTQPLFLVTDSPEAFRSTGEKFWGTSLMSVQWVDICSTS